MVHPGDLILLVIGRRSVLSSVQVERAITPCNDSQAEERISHQTIDIYGRQIPLLCRLWLICPRSGGSRKPSAAWVTDVIFGDNEETAPGVFIPRYLR